MRNKRHTSYARWLEYVSWAIFVLASIYSFSLEFFGLECPDTFYYACLYTSDYFDVFRPLSEGLFLLVNGLAGGRIIVLRLFNWLAYYMPYLAVCLYARRIVPNQKHIVPSLSAIALVMFPLVETTAFNGNALSSLFLVFGFLGWYEYRFYGNLRLIVAGSFALLCAILSRFPNIVILPILIFGIPFLFKGRKYILSTFLCLAACGITYLIVNILIYGDLGSFLITLKGGLTTATDSEAMNHSTSVIMAKYLQSLRDIVRHYKWIGPLSAVLMYCSLIPNKWIKRILETISLFLLCAYVYLKLDIHNPDTWHYVSFMMAVTMLPSFVSMVNSLLNHDIQKAIWSIMPIVFSAVAAAGADSGLFLMAAPLFAFFPWGISISINEITNLTKSEFFLVILSILGLSAFALCYCHNGWHIIGIIGLILWCIYLYYHKDICNLNKRYSKEIAAISIPKVIVLSCFLLVFLSILAKWSVKIDDCTLPELTFSFSEPQLVGIHSNQKTVEWVNEVMTEYERYKDKEVIFYGYMSAIFSYLSGVGVLPGLDFSYRENRRNISVLKDKVNSAFPVVILCPLNPGVKPLYQLYDYPKIDSLLLNRGYEREESENYWVYFH